MKKLILMTVCLMACGIIARAQSETYTIKPTGEGNEAGEVVHTMERDFSQGMVRSLSFLPAILSGQHWTVEERVKGNGKLPDHYFVDITVNEAEEDQKTLHAMYDKEGRLVSSYYVSNNEKLPGNIVTSLMAAHPNCAIVSDKEEITYKHGQLKEVFTCTIHDGSRYRKLVLRGDGTILKDVSTRHAG